MVKFIAFLGLACLISTTSAFCKPCGLGSGENVCEDSKCAPLVVRPVDLPKPPSLQEPKVVCKAEAGLTPLAPVPGPCSCTKAIVKPAVVPKPVCLKKVHKHHHHSYSEHNHHHHEEAHYHVPSIPHDYASAFYPNYGHHHYGNPALVAPADPVSLSIAYKLAQKAATHSEDKLAFGFRKIPKELPPEVKVVNNIPEENLYGLNGQIVELKNIAAPTHKNVEEEAAEDLLALNDEEDEIHANAIKKISLGELGYAPAKIQKATFVDVPVATVSKPACAPKPCNDGFVPGSVGFHIVNKPQEIVFRPKLESCGDSVETIAEPGYKACGCGYFKSGHKNSYLLEKLVH